jgi:uncharacterized protein YcbX
MRGSTMAITVTRIARYPVKSCKGEPVQSAGVEPWGLAGDRRWMIVDSGGSAVTAREHPPLLLVTPRADGMVMRFARPLAPDLVLAAPPAGELLPVDVWGTRLLATTAGEQSAAWFSEVTGVPVRLVYLDDPSRRHPNPGFSQPGDVVSFADGYPLLLASEDSLVSLNDLIVAGPLADEGPMSMQRFRPNVVVAGAPAWAEDRWRRIRIGSVVFRAVKGCDRCVLTTIDPETAERGKEPIATLARYRKWDGKVWFGVNLIPDQPASGDAIRVGDPVEILAEADSEGPLRQPAAVAVTA